MHWVEQLGQYDLQQRDAPALAPDPHCTVLWGKRTFQHSCLPPSMGHDVLQAGTADSLNTCAARGAGASGIQFHHRTGHCTVFALHSDQASQLRSG